MRLSPEQVERFYHIWFALLRFVNEQRQLISDFPTSGEEGELSTSDELQMRDAFWADESLLQQFLATNPAGLGVQDLAVVESWQARLAGSFFVVRALKTSTVFLSDHPPQHAYAVLGLLRSVEEAAGLPLPFYTQAVLLPFEGRITYDGLLRSYNAVFGPGIRRSLNESYRNAVEREGLITSLTPSELSLNEQRTLVQDRNAKLLQVFRKHLVKTGLSLKMTEEHTANIAAFAQAMLTREDPPRGLFDMTVEDVQTFLHTARTKTTITSFKRFIRFLLETGRMKLEQTQALQEVLKQT